MYPPWSKKNLPFFIDTFISALIITIIIIVNIIIIIIIIITIIIIIIIIIIVIILNDVNNLLCKRWDVLLHTIHNVDHLLNKSFTLCGPTVFLVVGAT